MAASRDDPAAVPAAAAAPALHRPVPTACRDCGAACTFAAYWPDLAEASADMADFQDLSGGTARYPLYRHAWRWWSGAPERIELPACVKAAVREAWPGK